MRPSPDTPSPDGGGVGQAAFGADRPDAVALARAAAAADRHHRGGAVPSPGASSGRSAGESRFVLEADPCPAGRRRSSASARIASFHTATACSSHSATRRAGSCGPKLRRRMGRAAPGTPERAWDFRPTGAATRAAVRARPSARPCAAGPGRPPGQPVVQQVRRRPGRTPSTASAEAVASLMGCSFHDREPHRKPCGPLDAPRPAARPGPTTPHHLIDGCFTGAGLIPDGRPASRMHVQGHRRSATRRTRPARCGPAGGPR